MQHVETRGGTVAVEERGTGLPIVLLPSGGHTARDFAPIAASLAGHRVIAVDWPGHGASPAPPEGSASAMSFADAAEDVVARLAPEGAVIIGNSVGGFSAARLAARRPELVRALVLCSPGGFLPRSPQVRAFCAAMSRPGFLRRIYPRFATRYMRAARAEDRRVLDETVAGMRDPVRIATVASVWGSFASPEHDLRGAAQRIVAPTLVVGGRRDPVIPAKVLRRLAAALPDGRMLELDCGHVPFASEPEAFSAALRPFIAEVLAGDPPAHGDRAIGVSGL